MLEKSLARRRRKRYTEPMESQAQEQRSKAFLTGAFLAALTILAVAIAVVTLLFGWNPGKAWPLLPAAIGIAGLYAGLSRPKTYARGYVVPSVIFIFMAGIFSLFSFDLISDRFSGFVLAYWPLLLVAGTALILVTWRYSLFRREKLAEKNRRLRAAGASRASGARRARKARKADV